MANIKRFTIDWNVSGLTVYGIIVREADLYMLDDDDGEFAASPADPYISFTEDGVISGRYILNESRSAWDDGSYNIAIYSQSGASPVPADDTIIGSGFCTLSSDSISTETTYPTGTGGITLADIISGIRLLLDDTETPYLWSNDELTSYLNKTINELCYDMPLIEDGTTSAVCNYSLSTGDSLITLDSRVLIIKKAKLTSQSDPLELRTAQYMDANYSDWLNADNDEPTTLVTEGVGTGKVRLYPPTDSTDNLWLTVYRKQIVDLDYDTDSATQPEIPVIIHDRLDNGILYRAYSKQDADTYDAKKVRDHRALWLEDKEMIRRGVLKSTLRPEIVGPHPGFI